MKKIAYLSVAAFQIFLVSNSMAGAALSANSPANTRPVRNELVVPQNYEKIFDLAGWSPQKAELDDLLNVMCLSQSQAFDLNGNPTDALENGIAIAESYLYFNKKEKTHADGKIDYFEFNSMVSKKLDCAPIYAQNYFELALFTQKYQVVSLIEMINDFQTGLEKPTCLDGNETLASGGLLRNRIKQIRTLLSPAEDAGLKGIEDQITPKFFKTLEDAWNEIAFTSCR